MLTETPLPFAAGLLLAVAACSSEVEVPPPARGAPAAPATASLGASSPNTPAATETPPPTPSPGLPTATSIEGPIWLDEPVSNRATPISRGTLAINPGETTAVAADPDRDSVFVVQLATSEVVALAAPPAIGLGQVVFGAADTAFVTARQSGQVLRVDTHTPQFDATFEVCTSPQGLAYDETTNRLHVACRDGSLVSLNASTGEVTRVLSLDDDLRDVVVRGEGLVVSRFRSAEVLLLDSAGNELTRIKPAAAGAQVAWRTVLDNEGRILVAHQSNFTAPLPGTTYYGSPCGTSLSQPTVSLMDPELSVSPTTNAHFVAAKPLSGAAGVVDVALDPVTGRVVAVVPGNALAMEPREALMEVDVTNAAVVGGASCPNGDDLEHPLPEVPVSVAVGGSGTRYVLTREPAKLVIVDEYAIELSGESREDTGFRMFHMNTGLNVACASCHPEGREDGYTWQFQEIGDRRTQSLEGGISHLAPFHWEGDLPTLGDFVGEVMSRRMGLEVMPDERELAALASFIDRIALPAQRPSSDPTAAERGRVLFNDAEVGCASCHLGDHYTDNTLYDVGTGELLVTPPLVRVGERAPFMHDGCASTLLERFSACGGGDQHGRTSHLDELQVLDLVAFLETL